MGEYDQSKFKTFLCCKTYYSKNIVLDPNAFIWRLPIVRLNDGDSERERGLWNENCERKDQRTNRERWMDAK